MGLQKKSNPIRKLNYVNLDKSFRFWALGFSCTRRRVVFLWTICWELQLGSVWVFGFSRIRVWVHRPCSCIYNMRVEFASLSPYFSSYRVLPFRFSFFRVGLKPKLSRKISTFGYNVKTLWVKIRIVQNYNQKYPLFYQVFLPSLMKIVMEYGLSPVRSFTLLIQMRAVLLGLIRFRFMSLQHRYNRDWSKCFKVMFLPTSPSPRGSYWEFVLPDYKEGIQNLRCKL